jgi:hypothetical protein
MSNKLNVPLKYRWKSLTASLPTTKICRRFASKEDGTPLDIELAERRNFPNHTQLQNALGSRVSVAALDATICS